MFKKIKQLDYWLESHLEILIWLLVILVLRIPNLFEPYWYGDEGIYLTIGHGLKNGLKLYSQIIDHKTPLIYYFAMVPSQLWFRVLNIFWTSGATIFFYHLCKKLFLSKKAIRAAMLIFVALTTLPWLEGNIPNGELFVLGFVLAGSYFFSKSSLFTSFFYHRLKAKTKFDHLWLLCSGLFFGLAILTKIPALFDLIAFGSIGLFLVSDQILNKARADKYLGRDTNSGLIIIYGALLPIIVSVIYFILRGSGLEYLEYGLLYNFKYAGAWEIGLKSEFMQLLFTLPVKFVVVTTVLAILTWFRNQLSPIFRFISAWLILSLFASLLSNRPYPHYFIQTVPAFALTIGYLMSLIPVFNKQKLKENISLPLTWIIGSSLLFLVVGSALAINIGLYPTGSYYLNFYQYITKQKTELSYFQDFNSLMTDNYQAAKIIRKSGTDSIFIWGTNPMLYALSGTYPTGRFTVSFHIKDLAAYEETILAVTQNQPKFIVVMENENQDLPGLNNFLRSNYILNSNYQHFKLWKRSSL